MRNHLKRTYFVKTKLMLGSLTNLAQVVNDNVDFASLEYMNTYITAKTIAEHAEWFNKINTFCIRRKNEYKFYH